MNCTRPKDLINDSRFKVVIDGDASSPDPALACWRFMHRCHSLAPPYIDKPPKNPTKSLLRHAIDPGRHWHVLDASYLVLHVDGFDHNTAMQYRTHRANHTLVQSMRHTSLDSTLPLADAFYIPPYLPETDRDLLTDNCKVALAEYTQINCKPETSRYLLPTNYRQGFTMCGTATAWMHMLDQRLLRDTQIEAQTAAWMMLDACISWWPELFNWYQATRAGRNMMAP